jgi:hypothetical protein
MQVNYVEPLKMLLQGVYVPNSVFLSFDETRTARVL